MKKWINALRIFIFCAIITVSYLRLCEIVKLKDRDTEEIMYSFQAMEEDTLDIVFIGSCHSYTSNMPLILWRDQGITSHVYGSSGQDLKLSYFFIQEMLKTQSPEIIVLDTYAVNIGETYIKESAFKDFLPDSISAMPFTLDKLRFLKYYPEINPFELLSSAYRWHQRWDYTDSPITSYDMEDEYKNSDMESKGWTLYWNNKPLENPESPFYAPQSDEVLTFIYPQQEEYLYKIIDLADENDIELIFEAAPYELSINENKRFNYLAQIAEKEGIPFINFNKQEILEEINLLNGDFRDLHHLNYFGATKTTNYISEFIRENYNIIDKRNHMEFQQWNIDSNNFFEEMDNMNSDAKIQE